MKTKMKISFKKVKSRPTNIDLEKIDKIKSLFAVKLSKEITSNTLLINIDETSINRFVKTNYSWGYKLKPIESRNTSFTESINWVLAICWNGSWLWFLVNQQLMPKSLFGSEKSWASGWIFTKTLNMMKQLSFLTIDQFIKAN